MAHIAARYRYTVVWVHYIAVTPVAVAIGCICSVAAMHDYKTAGVAYNPAAAACC